VIFQMTDIAPKLLGTTIADSQSDTLTELQKTWKRFQTLIDMFSTNAFRTLYIADDPSAFWAADDVISSGLILLANSAFKANQTEFRIEFIPLRPTYRPDNVKINGKVSSWNLALVPMLKVVQMQVQEQILRLQNDIDAADKLAKEITEARSKAEEANTPLYKKGWFWATVIGSVAVLGGGYLIMRRKYGAPDADS